jgi:hypothetical protein
MELLSEPVSPVSSVSPLIDIDQVGGLNVVRDAIRVRVAASVHNMSRRGVSRRFIMGAAPPCTLLVPLFLPAHVPFYFDEFRVEYDV